MDNQDLKALPYTATTLSVIGRIIFMFLLYKNKSTNSLSLTFCFLNIISVFFNCVLVWCSRRGALLYLYVSVGMLLHHSNMYDCIAHAS